MGRRRVTMRRRDVAPEVTVEACLDEEPSPETLAALDDVARAAALMLESSPRVSVVTVTSISGWYRVWCHACGTTRWTAIRSFASVMAEQHRCDEAMRR